MTSIDIPARRDLPGPWVAMRKDHLLGELGVHGGGRFGMRRAGTSRRRVRLVAVGAALVVAALLLSLPALGVGPSIVSLFAGWHDSEAPAPTASDVRIASGEAGVPWKIVATTSDQGLCLGLFHPAGADSLGSASCGYVDIQGDLPPEIRGDPASKCIGPPTARAPGGTFVACGSLRKHWIGPVGNGTGDSVGLESRFVLGPLARDVANVELVLGDGQRLEAHVVEQPGGFPLNVYWAAWPCRTLPVMEGPYADDGLRECAGDGAGVKVAIARDAAGRVLERRMPAWNGNPTGDPDGPAPPTTNP